MHIDVAILIDGYCPRNYVSSVVSEIHRLLWDIFHVCSFGVVQLIGRNPEYEPVIISLNWRLFYVRDAILLKDKLDLVSVNPATRVIQFVSKARPSLLTVHVRAWIGVELARNGGFRVANSIRKDTLPDLLLHLPVNALIPVPSGVLGVPPHLTVKLVLQSIQERSVGTAAGV
jgi:hypothetical protein